MPTQNPKRKPKPKKVNVSHKIHWQNIIKDIHTERVPISIVKTISLLLIDGTQVEINIDELLNEGIEHESLEEHIQLKFNELGPYIKNINFNINIKDIAEKVQPQTNEILKKICE